MKLIARKFNCLYMINVGEFFSIKYDGKKAVLKVLDIEKAKKLYDELPQKLSFKLALFDPVAYMRNIECVRRDNEEFQKTEAKRKKAREWEAMGPHERFLENPDRPGYDDL